MEKQKWTILDSRYIIRRPWLTARCDTVQLPDGRINDEYYILEYPGWVNVIAITEDGRYLMVEQYRHGLKDYFTELVAGVIEAGEEPLDAARRELREETGYAGGEWELLSVLSQNPSTTNNLTYCFVAKGVRKVSGQSLDATEDIAVKILTENELKELLVADSFKQSLMAAPLWKYFALKNSGF
ncbi:MAG: NUDIX hydrolase [Bacteroidales bacterium]|nr:NUDIX hydrolase [Bacteroidales bacterium]